MSREHLLPQNEEEMKKMMIAEKIILSEYTEDFKDTLDKVFVSRTKHRQLLHRQKDFFLKMKKKYENNEWIQRVVEVQSRNLCIRDSILNQRTLREYKAYLINCNRQNKQIEK